MQEQRSDDTPRHGSLLEAMEDPDEQWRPRAEEFRFGRLWNHSSGPVVPCEGCGTGVQRSKVGSKGRWCKRCAPIAQAMGPIRSAARKCVEFGLTDAAAALEKALEEMRAVMRTNSLGVDQ